MRLREAVEEEASGLSKRQRVFHPSGGPSLTKQSEAEGADVNFIVAQWLSGGTPVVNRMQAQYGDFSSGIDYTAAMNAVRDAERDFMALPAAVRSHVDNDPAEFLRLVHDPERRDELEQLGLLDIDIPPESAKRVVERVLKEKEEAAAIAAEEAARQSVSGDDPGDSSPPGES